MKLFALSFSFILVLLTTLSCTSKLENTEPNKEETPPQIASIELLVGTYTDQESKGIYLLDFDPATGSLSDTRLVVETTSPSFLAISKDRNHVYAVNETAPGNVSSFQWNEDRSSLSAVNQQPSQGDHPCFVEMNTAQNLLSVANYSSGTISVYPVDNAGMIGAATAIHQHTGSGPVKPNQNAAHAHCAKFDPNGKFLYAVDLGIDQLISYPIDEQGVVGKASSSLALDPGDGPRHMVFHPSLDMAFVVNELSGTVTSLSVNHESGQLEKIDTKSTLPADFEGNNACADIHISSNGKFLYASNRGHNSIAVFSVTEKGELELLTTESVQGDWPRNFTFSPDEKFLLVANQHSSNITVFAVNTETGLLSFTGHELSVSHPVCLKF